MSTPSHSLPQGIPIAEAEHQSCWCFVQACRLHIGYQGVQDQIAEVPSADLESAKFETRPELAFAQVAQLPSCHSQPVSVRIIAIIAVCCPDLADVSGPITPLNTVQCLLSMSALSAHCFYNCSFLHKSQAMEFMHFVSAMKGSSA